MRGLRGDKAVFINKKTCDYNLDDLFKKHYRYIYKVVLAIVLDQEMAKDVTQEAFLKAFLKIDTLKDIEKFEKWVYSIAVNTCWDVLRKTSKIKSTNLDIEDYSIEDTSSLPDEIYEQSETREEIVRCIRQMDATTQQIINLKYYLGFTYEEISRFMNISLSNVKVKLHRSKKKILSRLGKGFKREAL